MFAQQFYPNGKKKKEERRQKTEERRQKKEEKERKNVPTLNGTTNDLSTVPLCNGVFHTVVVKMQGPL